MTRHLSPWIAGALALSLAACGNPGGGNLPKVELQGPRFSLLQPAQTGVDFLNPVVENDTMNYFRWMYIYNGSGVAIGDINNDNLPDLYFTGNHVPNKLYLNKGGMKWEDITQKAGVGGGKWSAGATMADVNGDGLLDIYVSRGGPYLYNVWDRTNLLYINNGDLTFKEQAQQWQCNDAAFGTSATFLDYDLDGDLDLYTCNYPYPFGMPNQERFGHYLQPQAFESGRFFRNDGNKFTDITETCGVLRYGFGLGATTGDLNQDGYPDIYVSNDFQEPDFMFINQKDGTFKELGSVYTGHMSNFGMGNDIADYNNDGLLDVMVVDMMAENNRRKKTNMSGMNPAQFWELVAFGYHYQYMQNTLQLNQGNGYFSDVAQLAGVSTTDWSWAPLFADFDNDGWQDLFITNGYRRDARDNDYSKKIKAAGIGVAVNDYKTGLGFMPEERLPNYMYRNQGGLRMAKVTQEWGLTDPTWSNGAAYADLDNDGDLDLVVCNLDAQAMIYQNQTQEKAPRHWLRVRLEGSGANRFGLGAQVRLHQGGQLVQMRELTLSRGYQSSVEPILHFGLDSLAQVDEVEVIWPDRKVSRLQNVKADQVLTVKASESAPAAPKPAPVPVFTSVPAPTFQHRELLFDDFKTEILLPHRMSQLGPTITPADLDGDGIDEFYVGNGKGEPGAWFKHSGEGWVQTPNPKSPEEIGGITFDANGDGALDLLTLSGSGEYAPDAPELRPVLHLSKGKGQQPTRANADLRILDVAPGSQQAAAAHDIDGDGDQDLFIGGRQVPGKYPFAPRSYILQNDGKGNFSDITASAAPALERIGMVTAATWADLDGDQKAELVLVGEWMAPTILKNEGGKLRDISQDAGLSPHTGWWRSIALADLDGDKDLDIVAGNMGLNTKFPVSAKEPFHIYCHDFDQSGSLDIVLGYYNEGTCFPVRGRTCSSQQMPFIQEKFPTYQAFGTASLRDIYGPDLDKALHLQATTFASAVFLNDGKGHFSMKPLPDLAQLSAVNGIIVGDFAGDGSPDLLIAGNMHGTEVETSRADAGVGLLLIGDGKGGFRPVMPTESGFFAWGDIRDIKLLRGPRPTVVAVHGGSNLLMWSIGKKPS